MEDPAHGDQIIRQLNGLYWDQTILLTLDGWYFITNLEDKNMYLYKFISVISILLLLTNGFVKAQDELDVIRNSWLQYTDAPNSFYHFLTSEAYKLLESRAI